MRKWIQFPHKQGISSRQAHADLPKEGMFEREIGRDGFFGPATHMHHAHAPTGWVEWQGELKPRLFDLNKLQKESDQDFAGSPWSAKLILFNDFCKYRMWACSRPMQHLARNADGDELLFVHTGSGDLFCDYGHLQLNEGDYVVIPRATMWRVEPIQAMQLLMIEASNDSYQLPEKGLLGAHAIFDPATLDTPQIDELFKAQQDESTWHVEVKRHNQISTITYPFNPLDAVGWHGDLSVVRINWRDIRPVMSHRYHLPPSAHTTFVANRFVICTFVPRPIESDPGALKVPFFHNNDDFDEVLFYHSGDFFSRDNIDAGMVSFHPAGFTHGPHPKAYNNSQSSTKTFIQEVAVMLDTRDALHISDEAKKVEFADYVYSWKSEP